MEQNADGAKSAQLRTEASTSRTLENGSTERAAEVNAAAADSTSKKPQKKKTQSASMPTDKGKEDVAPPREKRSRTSTQPFQSSMVDQIQQVVAESAREKNQHSASTGAKVILYEKGEYLAVRCDGEDFFICKALQNVYRSSKKIKIHWLNNENQSAKKYYALDYADTIERETILTNLTLQKAGSRMELPDDEKLRTLNILNRAIKVQSGELPLPDPKALTADGLDVSLVTETDPESLEETNKPKKRHRKANRRKSVRSRDDSPSEDDDYFEEAPSAKVPKMKEPKPVPQGMIYVKGDFLAVKNDSDGYYLCKVVANVHQAAKSVHIQWLYAEPNLPNTFVLDYLDTIPTDSILTELTITRKDKGRIHVATTECRKAERILEERRKQARAALSSSENGGASSKVNTSEKVNGTGPDKTKPENPAGMRLTIRRKNDDHSSSLLATDIPQMTEDPLWNDNNPEGGNISPTSDSTDRLFACVLNRDHEGLKKLLSSARIISPYVYQSVHVQKLALGYAVEAEDSKSIRILLGRECSIKTCRKETNLLRCLDGERNKKEGNGALLQDYVLDPSLTMAAAISKAKEVALKQNVMFEILEELLGEDAVSEANAIRALEYGSSNLVEAIVCRLRENGTCSKSIISRIFTPGSLEPSDLSTVVNSNGTTVFHLLMAMPKVPQFLNTSTNVSALLAKRDCSGKAPIHYAAVSECPAALEWLLSKGANVWQVDNEGRNVLHVFASHGREVSLTMLKSVELRAHIEDTDRYGQTPLHTAIISCQPIIVERLLAFGADANKPLGSHSDRVTPLMLAAQRGNHLQMLILLLKYVDRVDAQDKRDRSALIHAAMNGHTAAACLLLRHGANPHLIDNSGNCALHHAAAYGHLFVVKLLVEIANLSPAQLNDAKMCSLEVAFRKGHIGLVKYMLGLGCFARGFDCELGEALLASCLQMGDLLEPTQVARFEVLLKSCPQLALRTDAQGNNVYGRLVQMEHRVMLQQLDKSESVLQEHRECLEKIVQLVLSLPVAERGLKALNNERETPVSFALSAGRVWFAAQYGKIATSELRSAINSESALKNAATHCSSYCVAELMSTLIGQKSQLESLKKLCRSLLKKGCNLLLLALQSAEVLDVPGKVKNVCSFVQFLFSVLEHEPSGAILHAAVRCRSTEILRSVLECAGSGLNREHRQKGLTALQEAAERGNSEAVVLLVQHGAETELMMPPSEDRPAIPLFLFCCLPECPFKGDVIRAFVKRKTPDLLKLHPVDGNSAIHYVVQKRGWSMKDRLETLSVLLENGLSASARNVLQQTPLHLAALNNTTGNADIEHRLVKAGAAIGALDSTNRLPLHYLFLNPNPQRDPIEVCQLLAQASTVQLINDSPDRREMQTVMHYVAAAGATRCCEYLLSLGVNIEVRNKDGNTPAGLAIHHKRRGTLLALVRSGCSLTEEICLPPAETVSSPHLIWRYVCPKQGLPLRKTFLQAVFELDSDEDKRSLQPYGRIQEDAISNLDIPRVILDELEKSGLPISVAIDAAIRAENYSLALELLKRVDKDWALTPVLRKQTLLHLVAQQKYSEGQLDVVKALLDREVIPQALDEHGCSALTYVNVNWNHVLAKFLLEKIGVEAAAQLPADRSFRTPLSAIFWKLDREEMPEPMIEITLQLIRAGANINVLSCFPVLNLEFPGTVCVSENVMHVTHSAAARISPLILAVCKKNHKIAKFLLREGGADPNFVDGQQRTALMYAVKLNDMHMAKLLLNYDYNIDEDELNPSVERCLPGPEALLRDDEDIRNFAKTSPVDLGHQDIYGWTVIHHVIAPLPEITYASTRILRLLATVKAPLTVPDRNSIVPLHLSAARGVESLTLALQELIADDSPCPRIAYHGLPAITDDDVMDSIPVRDFNTDYEAYEEQQKRKHGDNNGHRGSAGEHPVGNTVHSFALSDSEEWEIVTDPKTQVSYDVLLTKLDPRSIYVYCKLQLMTTLGRTRFVVEETCGRVGCAGDAEATTFSSEADAVQEFRRQFQLRTGEKFEEMSSLRFTPSEFRPVIVNRPSLPRETDQDNPAKTVMDFMAVGTRGSKLSQPVQDLLTTIFRNFNPAFPVPTEDCLRQALSILEEMRQLASEKRELQKSFPLGDRQLDELKLRLGLRSHQYHALLPPEYGLNSPSGGQPIELERIEPLRTENEIDTQLDRVVQYLNVKLSQKILKAALFFSTELNPLDYVYRMSQCKIQQLPISSLEMQTVLQYIHNSSRHEQIVKKVFRLSRETEEAAMAEGDVGNHWLLWHPVEATSLLSVLYRGVQATPLGAGWPAQVKGIKFYDRFEHEIDYHKKSPANVRFELLCQVALGDQNAKPGKANGGNSVALNGRWGPDAADHVSWQSCLLPLGPTVLNGAARGRAFNEYVVYKPQQVCIRYLVEYQHTWERRARLSSKSPKSLIKTSAQKQETFSF